MAEFQIQCAAALLIRFDKFASLIISDRERDAIFEVCWFELYRGLKRFDRETGLAFRSGQNPQHILVTGTGWIGGYSILRLSNSLW